MRFGFKPSVACCVTGSKAKQSVIAAIAAAGAVERNIASADRLLTDLLSPQVPSALIYDLAPWDRRAPAILRALRERLPSLPMLLYPPGLPGVGDLILGCGNLSGLHAELQRNEPHDVARLCGSLRRIIAEAPCQKVLQIFNAFVPQTRIAAANYVRWILQRLASEADWSTLTVSSGARVMGVSPRTLERALRHGETLPPKELLDWIVLLFVYVAAADGNRSTGEIGRTIGLDSQRLYRLRHRLLPPRTRDYLGAGAGQVDLVLLAFAERCGVSKQRALALLA